MEYHASETLWRFHQSNELVRCIRGPVGSGKSTACCWELWIRAHQQKPAPDGKRYSAFAIVRNSYAQLRDTTLATWLDWFSEERVGKFNYSAMEHVISFGDVEMHVLFRSLDRPQDIKKILSLEITGAWFNEAREMPRTVVNRMIDRVGRYPAKRIGGASWRGVILDTNPPDDGHWLMDLEREPP